MFKFDELEETIAEIKLKELLWTSLDEWDKMYAVWSGERLDRLEMDALNQNVNKYGKYVYQIEKGLPPNTLVPKLRERVDDMRAKMPVITDLRNPSLRKRHWDVIYQVIGFTAVPEDPLTLGKLVEIDAFQYAERIQEISGQASSEASLELILKKVRSD